MTDEQELLAAPAEEMPRYGMRAGRFLLLADTGVSVQVVDVPRMCPFPNAPPGFRGVINLRGDLVPVFDLRMLDDAQPTERGKLAVCGEAGDLVALLVAGMPERLRRDELVEADPAAADELPERVARAVRGAFRRSDEIWLEVDYATLFSALAEPPAQGGSRARISDEDLNEVLP